jgi:hypothetical protein
VKSVLESQEVLQRARGISAGSWTPYLSLWVGDPLAGGVEVSGNGYVRRAVTFAAPVSNSMTNTNAITFPNPSGPWGASPLTHMALMDALTGGNVRHTYLLSGTDFDRTVSAGTAPVFVDVGAIQLAEM